MLTNLVNFKDENMGKVNGDKGHGDDRLQFLEDQCKLQVD